MRKDRRRHGVEVWDIPEREHTERSGSTNVGEVMFKDRKDKEETTPIIRN